MDAGHRQPTRFGAELAKPSVTDVKRVSGGFELVTEQETLEARQVILATGAAVDLAEKSALTTKAESEPRMKAVLAVDAAGRTEIPRPRRSRDPQPGERALVSP